MLRQPLPYQARGDVGQTARGSADVARLDRPSGNITGFGIAEPSLGGKWLELAESAPAASLRDARHRPAQPRRRKPHTEGKWQV
jgi:hypothetical protein